MAKRQISGKEFDTSSGVYLALIADLPIDLLPIEEQGQCCYSNTRTADRLLAEKSSGRTVAFLTDLLHNRPGDQDLVTTVCR